MKEKAEKHYPAGTVLIVHCTPTGLVVEDKWLQAIEIVKAEKLIFPFGEVLLTGAQFPWLNLYSSAPVDPT